MVNSNLVFFVLVAVPTLLLPIQTRPGLRKDSVVIVTPPPTQRTASSLCHHQLSLLISTIPKDLQSTTRILLNKDHRHQTFKLLPQASSIKRHQRTVFYPDWCWQDGQRCGQGQRRIIQSFGILLLWWLEKMQSKYERSTVRSRRTAHLLLMRM